MITVYGKNDFTVTQPTGHSLPAVVEERPKYSARMAEVLHAAACKHGHTGSTTRLQSRGARATDHVHGCTICCEELSHNVWALRCGHVFHGECLNGACKLHMECPICRTAIHGVDDLRRIFLT